VSAHQSDRQVLVFCSPGIHGDNDSRTPPDDRGWLPIIGRLTEAVQRTDQRTRVRARRRDTRSNDGDPPR
jgi:hypothetical protein